MKPLVEHHGRVLAPDRHLQRLRQVLREYYPGLLDAPAAAKLELGDPGALVSSPKL